MIATKSPKPQRFRASQSGDGGILPHNPLTCMDVSQRRDVPNLCLILLGGVAVLAACLGVVALAVVARAEAAQ